MENPIPVSTQFTDPAEYRDMLCAHYLDRLQHAAWRALYVRGLQNHQFIVVCIQVDSSWRNLVDQLMPGFDWDSIRDRGEEPIASGIALWATCNIVAERLSDIAKTVREVPPEGKVKAIVLSHKGGTIYELEPKPEVATLN